MERPDGVEFLTGDADESSYGEDVVEFGRGRTPRSLLIAFGVVVIALGATTVVTRAGHEHAPLPASLASDPAPPPVLPSGVLTAYVGSALAIGPTAVVDVAVMRSRLYVLQVGRLAAVDPKSSRMIAHVAVGDSAAGAAIRLVTDASNNRVWVISIQRTPASITEFDGRTLTRLRTTTWPAPVHAAVILDGYLYLQTDGVAVLGPDDAAPHLVQALARETGSIAADPLRHRLLVMRFGSPTHVLTYSPGGAVHVASTALDVTKADLAVVDGHVWLGGFGPAGAELEQLDPMTFTPGPNNPLFDFLGAGALIVARGQHVVWVRAATGQMVSGVSCIDAANGHEVRSWFGINGQVGSANAAAFIADGSAVLPLQLGPCRG